MRADQAPLAAGRAGGRWISLLGKLVLVTLGAAIFLILPTLPAPLAPTNPLVESVTGAAGALSEAVQTKLSTFAVVALGLSALLLLAAATISLTSWPRGDPARTSPLGAAEAFSELSLPELKQQLRSTIRRPDTRVRMLSQARALGLGEREAHAWALSQSPGKH